jgi:putative flippase GtrA
MFAQYIKRIYGKHRHFVLYSLIGATGASIDFLIFLLLTSVTSLNYLPANIISVSCGITNNFIWNVKFNFTVKEKLFIRFIAFYCIGLTGMGLSTLLLYLLVDLGGIESAFAKLMTIGVVVIIQFWLNKYISFRQKEKVEETA